MNRRERKNQERREWRRLWTRSWRPWTETHPAIEALTLKVKASGVEALNPANQDVWSYSARDVPFHECGNPNCSIGGIDLRPLVTEMIAEGNAGVQRILKAHERDFHERFRAEFMREFPALRQELERQQRR